MNQSSAARRSRREQAKAEARFDALYAAAVATAASADVTDVTVETPADGGTLIS